MGLLGQLLGLLPKEISKYNYSLNGLESKVIRSLIILILVVVALKLYIEKSELEYQNGYCNNVIMDITRL